MASRSIIGGVIAATLIAGISFAQRPASGGAEGRSGSDLYTHICQGCHMPDGKGAAGAAMYGYPALAGDARLESAGYAAMVVVNGQKAMPAFADLSDVEVAAVVNYVRTHFGNHYDDALAPGDVKPLRPEKKHVEDRRPG